MIITGYDHRVSATVVRQSCPFPDASVLARIWLKETWGRFVDAGLWYGVHPKPQIDPDLDSEYLQMLRDSHAY